MPSVDPETGNLLVGGRSVFPLGLSDPPPLGGRARGGGDAWAEIARAGVSFVRNYTVWSAAAFEEQALSVARELDAAPGYGLLVWLGLAGVDADLSKQALLDRILDRFQTHPGLGLWKGADEPAHARLPAASCVAVYKHLKARDPKHPVVIIEAPRAPAPVPGRRDRPLTAAAIAPYAAACDIHGVDIYPVSMPPGAHAGGPPVNTDISVVGDMTRIVATATRRKAIWTTLQIAFSGVFPPHRVVFPTLQQARFMAYDAIISGARGLFFFGGQFTQVMSAADKALGWNWTYWHAVQRPLLAELSDPEHAPALTAPVANLKVTADAPDIAISVRETADFLYLLAIQRSATQTVKVRFAGLPAGIRKGTVLAHGPSNPARTVTATGGAFTDPSPFAPHNARVYRFPR